MSAHDCAHFTSETTERISIKFSILGCTIKATEHDEFSSYRSNCKHGSMLPATQIVLQRFLRNDGLQNRFVNEISCTCLSHCNIQLPSENNFVHGIFNKIQRKKFLRPHIYTCNVTEKIAKVYLYYQLLYNT